MLRSRCLIIVFNILIFKMALIAYAFDIRDIEVSPKEIFQGDVLYIKIKHSEPEIEEIYFQKNRLPLFTEDDVNKAAIAGVDMNAKPGISEITFIGKGRIFKMPVEIKERIYKTEILNISEEPLSDESIKRIENEREKLIRLFNKITPEKLWIGAFILPVKGIIKDNFGSRRIINGVERQPHSGIDIKGRAGDNVVASNRGIVCFTGELYFGGNAVIINHGYGLFSMYFHLSEILVDEGKIVNKGDVIGKIGKSGRTTGSHLHFGVRILNARVDPLRLINE